MRDSLFPNRRHGRKEGETRGLGDGLSDGAVVWRRYRELGSLLLVCRRETCGRGEPVGQTLPCHPPKEKFLREERRGLFSKSPLLSPRKKAPQAAQGGLLLFALLPAAHDFAAEAFGHVFLADLQGGEGGPGQAAALG